MLTSVVKNQNGINPNNMAFRGNQNRNRAFGGNYGGNMGGGNRMGNLNMSPWEPQNTGGNFSGGGGGGGGGNMRQGGGQGMNAQALNLANNLLNNLFRNQNPPSLLDLPRGGGGMGGNRNQRGGQMINRGGGNRVNNNRRIQGGFPNNRGASGLKSNQKQGAGGIRKQNAFDRAKKLLAKNANNKKKDFAPGDKKPESKKSAYSSVPNDMFYCHLCKKHMWDATSFENHIKGRTHLMMREGIEESYRLKANMIRQEAKIAEQLKSIELDRLKRMGKSKQRQLEYCTMCDLNFHGHISGHRKTEGHLQLKKFLHPKCVECIKEFATRIDYDTHLLSAEHLIKAAEKNTKVGERKQNTLTIHTEEEELKDVRVPQRRRKNTTVANANEKKEAEGEAGAEVKQELDEEGNPITMEQEASGTEVALDASNAEANETKTEGENLNETQEEEDAVPPVDAEDVILDYAEADEIPIEVENRLPKYSWTRPVGAGLITKIECYECALCSKFMDNEQTVEVHARTVSHHRNFLKFINDKASDTKIAQKRAAAAIEENERKKRCLEEAEMAPKNGEQEETNETTNGGAGGGEDEEQNDDHDDDDNNGDLYDPSQATGDDDDVEMAEVSEEQNEQNEMAEDEQQEEEVVEEQKPQQKPTTTAVATPVAAPVNPTPSPAKTVTKVNDNKQESSTPVKTTPVKTTPVKAQVPAVTPNNNQQQQQQATTTTPTAVNNSPAQNQQTESTPTAKRGGARGGGGAKGTPRGRGRGRYSRY